MKAPHLACALAALAVLAPRTAFADAKSEAAARFDRGIALFDAHDYTRALAELRRAYELAPNAEVLYDIALIEVALGKPVEALTALDGTLAAPAGLAPAELARAKQLRAAQAALVANLTVKSNVVGAHVEIDGIEVATTPLPKAIPIASGTHVVALVAPGYVPRRKEITVAGNVDQTLDVPLEPLEGRLAHLLVRSHLPGADVYANGQRVGTTPLRASLAFAPGTYAVEVRRADYSTASVTMKLDEGATGEITLDPTPDTTAVVHDGAALRVVASEPGATLTVDGRALGIAGDAVPLAPGPHDILVEHAGFVPAERSVVLDAHRETEVHTYLAPTNETRAEYVSRTSSRRLWSTVALGTGVALVAAGTVYAIVNSGKISSAQSTYDAFERSATPGSGGRCDPKAAPQATCSAEFDVDSQRLDDAKNREVAAFIVLGVGAAIAGVGAYFRFTGEDPHRYDHPPRDARRNLVPIVAPLPNGGFFGATGTF